LTEAERAFQSAVRGNDDEVKKFIRTLGDFGDGVDRHNGAQGLSVRSPKRV
jgi:hypothetical protein